MAKQTDVIVYIGRFNPFHLGHEYVLKTALQNAKLVIVLVGSSFKARSIKNPFNFAERQSMIVDWYKALIADGGTYGALEIRPIRDFPYSDIKWINQVQQMVSDTVNESNARGAGLRTIALTGSDRDESTWYLSSFPQWSLNLLPEFSRPPDYKVSATSVREILFGDIQRHPDDYTKLQSKVPATTAAFLLKFLDTDTCALMRQEVESNRKTKARWAMAPYAPIFVTVDCVIIQSGHLLVIRRAKFPGKGLLALPGGFLDPHERLLDGAIREAGEETGLLLAEGKRAKDITDAMLRGSMKAKEIFDDPDRSQRGRTVTVGFVFKLDDTKPLAKVRGQNCPLHETGGAEVVETLDAFWMPISEALSSPELFFEDHDSIIEWGVNALKD